MSPRLDQVGPLVVFVYSHEEHRLPHVHVRGGGHRATIDLWTGSVLAGHLPAKLHREVRRWLEPRKAALVAAYAGAVRHEHPATIKASYEEQTRGLG